MRIYLSFLVCWLVLASTSNTLAASGGTLGTVNTINSSYVPMFSNNNNSQAVTTDMLIITRQNADHNLRKPSIDDYIQSPLQEGLGVMGINTVHSIELNSELEVSQVLSRLESDSEYHDSDGHLADADLSSLFYLSEDGDNKSQYSEDGREEANNVQVIVLPEVICANEQPPRQVVRCVVHNSNSDTTKSELEHSNNEHRAAGKYQDSELPTTINQVTALSEAIFTNTILHPIIARQSVDTKQDSLSLKTFATQGKQHHEYDIYGKGFMLGANKNIDGLAFGLRYGASLVVAKNASGNTIVMSQTFYPYIAKEEANFKCLVGSQVSNIQIKKHLEKSAALAVAMSIEMSNTIDLSYNFTTTPKWGVTYNYLNIESAATRPKQQIEELILNTGLELKKEITINKSTVLTPSISYGLSQEIWQQFETNPSFLVVKQPSNITHRIGVTLALRKNAHNYSLIYNTYIAPQYRDQEIAFSYRINF